MSFVTLGETMIKLTPPGPQRLEQTTQLDLTIGGAESNVAVALSRMGKQSIWISRLPDNPLGFQISSTLRRYGVNTDYVRRAAGERVGTYYAEFGPSPRPIRVWYDRADSAASRMTPDDLPLDVIAEADWLHATGITPALSESCAETVRVALNHARSNGVKISFDVNYRALLWTPEQAAAVLTPMCEIADVVFVAGRDAADLFGAPESAQDAASDLQTRWGGTLIVSDGEDGVYGHDGQNAEFAQAYEAEIVDRFGAGDALAAGVICRLMEDAPLDDALRFGAALAALQLTIPGDFALVSRYEVEALLQKRGTRVQR